MGPPCSAHSLCWARGQLRNACGDSTGAEGHQLPCPSLARSPVTSLLPQLPPKTGKATSGLGCGRRGSRAGIPGRGETDVISVEGVKVTADSPELWHCCATTRAAGRGLIPSTTPRVSESVCLVAEGMGIVCCFPRVCPGLPSPAQAAHMAGAGSGAAGCSWAGLLLLKAFTRFSLFRFLPLSPRCPHLPRCPEGEWGRSWGCSSL